MASEKTDTPFIASYSTDTDLANDFVTTDTALSIAGTSIALASIVVSRNEVTVGTTTANSSGSWTFNDTVTADTHDYQVSATTPGKSVSNWSNTLRVTVLPTPTWSANGINDFVLNSAFLDVGNTKAPRQCFLSPNGLFFHVIDDSDGLIQYSLTVKDDITTAVRNGNILLPGITQEQGLTMSINGTRVYACGSVSNKVIEYALSIPWDIATLTATGSEVVHGHVCQGLHLSPDGTKLYVTTSAGSHQKVSRYVMSTPLDFSTRTLDHVWFISGETAPQHAVLTYDGTKMLTMGDQQNEIREYALATPWAIDAGVTLTRTISTTAYAGGLQGASMNWEQTKLYVVDAVTKYIRMLER